MASFSSLHDHITYDTACVGCRYYYERKAECTLAANTNSNDRIITIKVTKNGMTASCTKWAKHPAAED